MNTYGWLFQKRFAGDIASRMLLVLGPHLQLGNPYKDLWEIIPPGYILVLQIWATLFGDTPLHFVLLHFFILLISAPLLYLVLKKIFSGILFYLVLFFTALVLYSPAINSMYISSEIFGVFFSLLALTSLYYINNKPLKLALSTASFLIAGQMKDPFIFGIIAVLPIFLWEFLFHSASKFRKKLFLSTITGFLAPILFFYIYLVVNHANLAYSQVLNNKTQFLANNSLFLLLEKPPIAFGYVGKIFQFFFMPLNEILTLMTIGLLMSFIFKRITISRKSQIIQLKINPKIKLSSFFLILNEKIFIYLSIVAYSIGSFLGMALQGKFSTHYLIQGVIPLFIILGIFVEIINFIMTSIFSLSKKSFLRQIVFIAIALILLTPKPSFLHSYLYYWDNGGLKILASPKVTLDYFKTLSSLEKTDQEKVDELINDKVNPDECILHVYGWNVAPTYLYSERKPCTRFFLPNIVDKDWQKAEYKEAILNNPPAAVVYGWRGSDFNYLEFEAEVLPVAKILEECYYQDEKFSWFNKTNPATLYWPNSGPEATKNCILETVK